jgi:RNA polymerase sigma factor (sigma-70 family)
MATAQPGGVLRHLRRTALRQDDLSDGQLLEGFLAGRDEAAFEVLLGRHGPMVLSVCRRVLGNDADAEDAFQATFLVLIRKANAVRRRNALASFLYGVARNTALKARAMNHKRRSKEQEAAQRAAAAAPSREEPLDERLDEELGRLPDRYREALVMCDLEGRTLKEAAKELGCPQGTVASRLARGRGLLARRLARRGLELSGVGLIVALGRSVVAASVSAALAQSTRDAAVLAAAGEAATGVVSAQVLALTERVVKAMLLHKLKAVAVATLLVGLLVGGAVALTAPVLAQRPPGATEPVAPPPQSTPKQQGGAAPVPPAVDAPARDPVTAPKPNGRLKAVEPAGKHVVLTFVLENGATVQAVYSVPESAEVLLAGGKAGKVADLKEGQLVEVEVSEKDPQALRAIRVQLPPSAPPAATGAPTPKTEPREELQGKVIKVQDRLILVSLSDNHGVEQGDTLEVYRLEPKPLYCGRLVVLEVKGREVVGEMKDSKTQVKVNDLVARQILGRN